MGILLSVVISYAGVLETLECLKYLLRGLVPNAEPDFQDIIDYYTRQLQAAAKQANSDWTRDCGQGYLCLTEDDNGKLKSAAVKYYDGQAGNSTALLFSTKISSFGQESVDDNSPSHANGDFRSDRYTPTKTKTLTSKTSESFSIGIRNRSPSENVSDSKINEAFESKSYDTTSGLKSYNASDTKSNENTPEPKYYENISDSNRFSPSFERDERDEDSNEAKEKLTWHYRPLTPTPPNLPEIHFQSSEGDQPGDNSYSEDYLRSLDGIKFRPLQRSDPSGRRRSYKKRHSSSSTSSRESRASREEELKMFTSLEEAEFESMSREALVSGSSPNLAAHSHSRSRSRENSRDRRNESWSVDASVDSVPEDVENAELKPRQKDLPKLDSFEEEKEETKEPKEVTEEEDELDDFWGNSGD